MNPVQIHWNRLEKQYQYNYDVNCDPMRSIHVACGRCPACASKWRTQLAQRALMELNRVGFENSCFLTLTLADDKLESAGIDKSTMSLNHYPVQKFIKRLRAKLNYDKAKVLGITQKELFERGENVQFKYLACGEYGEKNGRPHWHMLIFGWCPQDLVYFSKSKKGHNSYKSKVIDDCWQYGIADVGTVTVDTVPYMAKYIVKEKEVRKDEYINQDGVIIKKPYLVYPREMLGLQFFLDNYKAILRLGYIITNKGTKISVPKSFLKKAEELEYMQDELDFYKRNRQEYYDEVNEELKKQGIVTPTDRFMHALELGMLHRENYNSYMRVKGVETRC